MTPMLDWNQYRRQILAANREIARISPDTLAGYRALSDAGVDDHLLDVKTRELIALAVSVTRQCDGCITVHATAAARAGATKEEVMAAMGVAVAVNAGAALVFSGRALEAFDAVAQTSAPAPAPAE